MKPSAASKILVVLLIILSLVSLGVMGAWAFGHTTADSSVKGNQFQALFLTNGQVYFGHLSNIDSNYVKLTDIYYLQVQQQIQPGQSSSSSSNSNPQISLAKLGSELHGPEDVMYVAHSQVLFWENLKNDGKVVQAISQYQSTNK